MILHCTLVPAPGSPLPPGPVELALEVPEGCSGARIQQAVSSRYGTGELSVNGSAVRALRVGDPPLQNGAVLVDGVVANPPAPGRGPGRCGPSTPPLFLAVHSGPGAGTIVPLGRGRFRIGRSGTDLVLPDAELSREHARLEVSDSAVTLVDLRSANGTTVDGERVRSSVVTTGSVIRCGNSMMSLIFGSDPAAAGVSDAAGRGVTEPLAVGSSGVGSAIGSRSALLLMAALPLAIGVGLVFLTRSWLFLAFSLASVASLLLPALSGRKQRRSLKAALHAAVGEDRDRRRRAAPSAAVLCSRASASVEPESRARAGVEPESCARAGVEPESGPGAGEPCAVWLRLGLADQRANLKMHAADPGFRAPPLGLVPLALDPAEAVTAVVGPQPDVAGLVRYFLAQLAGYPAARRTRVLVHGSLGDLPLAARFLPRVTLSCQITATAARLRAGPGPECDRGVLIVLHRAETHPGGALSDPFRTAGAADLADLAASKGWQVFQCGPPQDRSDSAAIILGGRAARLSRGGTAIRFLPDLVPYPVFDNFCRRLGAAGAPKAAPQGVLDRAVPLAGILPCEAGDVGHRWDRSADAAGLSVPVGIGRQGTVHLDIERDGPHLLVAGTTGSGKSEFLRTLVAALAASYPPDRINLLLVDFKGGSGLGPLTGLPHCVGMLSDLRLQEVDRTLVSLRAEIRRREELLASAGASDLTAYRALDRGLPVLPHLAIVIDEFRMLVDEAPRALTELMMIAAIGRSLGIHLIMATQRPQGSITADIRANVTSRIVLRVQSGMESIDVMNSTLAADIPIAAPGRAFLVKGSEAPQEFQTVRLTPDATPAGLPVTVLTAAEWLCRGPAEEPAQTDPAAAGAPATALTEVTGKLWSAGGGTPPHRPVAAALPAALPFPSSDSPGGPAPAGPARSASGPSRSLSGPAGAVRLGWLDLPEQQRLAELCWHPEDHGHLGLVGGAPGGGPRGAPGGAADGGAAAGGAAVGADAALALMVDQLLAAEHEFHLYILDAAGSLSGTVASPRVGARVGPHELRRAVRVLERLAAEMTRRLSSPHLPVPRLVLALCGWGSWLSAFRSGPLARGEDLVQDIVRDGSRAGIAVLVSGERELTTSRFFGGIANRIFFPAGCSDEDRIAWPRLPAVEDLPGRVAALGPFAGRASGAVPHLAQLYAAPPATLPACLLPPGGKAAFRVEALPQRVRVSEVLAKIGEPVRMPRDSPDSAAKSAVLTIPVAAAPRPPVRLCLGVGGDELDPAFLTLPAGGVLAALGGPGSGKTTLLAALAALNCPAGGWLRPAAGTDPAEYWAGLHARARGGALSREAVLLADDLDLQSEDTSRHLLGINGLGWTVVLTAGFSPALPQRVPLVQCARRNGTGILLCPHSLLDGDLFGVRFELDVSPPPGRGVLISGGLAVAVQLADPAAANPLRPARPDAA